MITVAHLITGLGLGGAERMLSKVVTHIPPDEQRHIVISMLEGGVMAEELRAANIDVYSLGMRRGIPSVSAFFKLTTILRKERPVILQTWLYHADLLGILAAKWTRIPRIVWNIRCSNTDMRKYRFTSTIVLHLLRLLSRWPDLILFNSVAGEKFHTAFGYHPRRSMVIANGFDTTKFCPDAQAHDEIRAQFGIADNIKLIGAVGRYDPAKDYPGFLQACSIIAKAVGDAHFMVVGDGVTADHPALAFWVQSPELRGRLHFPGGRKDIERYMAAFDVFVSPSGFGEGFPNVIGEAMSVAIPTVVTDVGDSALIVGRAGAVVPPGNPGELARAVLETLKANAPERAAMGVTSRNRIKGCYALPSIAACYADTYQSLAAEFHDQ